MVDHISFGVADFARSTTFYDQALAPLGVSRLFDVPQEQSGGVKATGYGDTHPWFWLAQENATSGMMHIALQAKNRAEMDAFHAAALHPGGIDNGQALTRQDGFR